LLPTSRPRYYVDFLASAGVLRAPAAVGAGSHFANRWAHPFCGHVIVAMDVCAAFSS